MRIGPEYPHTEVLERHRLTESGQRLNEEITFMRDVLTHFSANINSLILTLYEEHPWIK